MKLWLLLACCCLAAVNSKPLSENDEAVSVERAKRYDVRNPEKPIDGLISNDYPDEELKRLFLEIHNDYRRMEKATDMYQLEWSEDLAKMAHIWTGRCIYAHGHPEKYNEKFNIREHMFVGQNMGYSTQDVDKETFIRANLKKMWDEHVDWNYATKSCRPGTMCGHYRAIVFSESKELGCAVAKCPAIMQKYRPDVPQVNAPAWFLVCNFAPGITRKVIYKKGDSPCSQCVDGEAWCENGLCRSKQSCQQSNNCKCEAKCRNCAKFDEPSCSCECANGWLGPDCSEECKDISPKCNKPMEWPRLMCDHPKLPFPIKRLVTDGCPLMCGLCQAKQPGDVCNDDSATSNSATSNSATSNSANTNSANTNSANNNNNAGNPPQSSSQNNAQPSSNNANANNGASQSSSTISVTASENSEHKLTVTVTWKEHDITEFQTQWERMLIHEVVSAVTTWCNEPANFRHCCDRVRDGVGALDDVYGYLRAKDLAVVEGYPRMGEDGAYVKAYVSGSPGNPLCEQVQ